MRSLYQQFEQQGYIIVENLLSPSEVSEYIDKLQQISGLSHQDYDYAWSCANGVSKHPEFWSLIQHPLLVSKVREIFGDSAGYTLYSDLHVHRKGAGWHRDCAHRTYGSGPDWDESQEKYQIARVAIYLQSYEESGSSLVLIPGSHHYEFPLSKWERRFWKYFTKIRNRLKLTLPNQSTQENSPLQSLVRTTPSPYFMQPPTPPVYIKTEPGDCIIFDPRLIHSGSPIYGPKYAIFLTYGINNKHARNHMHYYLYTRTDLDYEKPSPELAQKLKEENLLMEV